jgi:hypothetical protein
MSKWSSGCDRPRTFVVSADRLMLSGRRNVTGHGVATLWDTRNANGKPRVKRALRR